MENHLLGYFLTETIYIIKEKNEQKVETSLANTFITLPDSKLTVVTSPLTKESRTLLEKIISAIQIDLSDVNILHSIPLAWTSTKNIIFLPSSEENLYTLKKIQNIELIYSSPLEQLQASREDKRLLWEALKKWV